jgi:hypothetical protein
MMANRHMQSGNPQDLNRDRHLEELFQGYRDACPDFEAGPEFMPQMWARIEAQEASTNWFGNIARGLVTAAQRNSRRYGFAPFVYDTYGERQHRATNHGGVPQTLSQPNAGKSEGE